MQRARRPRACDRRRRREVRRARIAAGGGTNGVWRPRARPPTAARRRRLDDVVAPPNLRSDASPTSGHFITALIYEPRFPRAECLRIRIRKREAPEENDARRRTCALARIFMVFLIPRPLNHHSFDIWRSSPGGTTPRTAFVLTAPPSHPAEVELREVFTLILIPNTTQTRPPAAGAAASRGRGRGSAGTGDWRRATPPGRTHAFR